MIKYFLHDLLVARGGNSEFYVLHTQMESQSKLLRSSAEMRESIYEANLQLQEKLISIQK